jgi:hypothetical protein
MYKIQHIVSMIGWDLFPEINTVDLGYKVLKRTEYFVSL